MYSRWLRNSFIYLLTLVAVIALVFSFFQPGKSTQTKPLNTVAQLVNEGKVKQIEVQGDSLTVTPKDGFGDKFKSRKESSGTLLQQLKDLGASPEGIQNAGIRIKEPSQF